MNERNILRSIRRRKRERGRERNLRVTRGMFASRVDVISRSVKRHESREKEH